MNLRKQKTLLGYSFKSIQKRINQNNSGNTFCLNDGFKNRHFKIKALNNSELLIQPKKTLTLKGCKGNSKDIILVKG